MSQAIKDRISKTLNIFRKRKVLTVSDLASMMQCSLITVRRKLKQWNTYTSYNKNGRYYVLPDVPSFDADGLWHWRGIFFSKHGNLTQTLVALVRNSKAGLNASEMEELLGLSPRSFLSSFRTHPDLRREKHQGYFVYFSSTPAIYEQQNKQRATMARVVKQPSDIEAIAILVETIKHPDLNLDQLCARLKTQKYDITPEAGVNLFAHHGVSVKKTPQ